MQSDEPHDIHADRCTRFVHRLAAFQEYDATCVALTGQHASAPALLLDRHDEVVMRGVKYIFRECEGGADLF